MKRDDDGYLETESFVEFLRSIRDKLEFTQTRDDLSSIIGYLLFHLGEEE